MIALAAHAKRAVPVPARDYWWATRRHRGVSHALSAVRRARFRDEEAWSRLVRAWGNEDMSAHHEYLSAVAAAARATEGPILECGSGLTTLVLADIARSTGAAFWSLEEDARWARRVRAALRLLRLSGRVFTRPLRDYGGFDWYDVGALELPIFSLVVCDGPVGDTRGGRYGLVPVLGGRLERDCLILLDDAGREGERSVLRRWETEHGFRCELRGREKEYAVVCRNGAADMARAELDVSKPADRDYAP